MARKTTTKAEDAVQQIQQRKKGLLVALEKALGIVTTACKSVGVDRGTFYNYYNSDPEFKAAVDELENVSLDFAESTLYGLMRDKNPAAVIFYLKTKGRKRGYTEHSSVEHSGRLQQEQHVIDYSKLSSEALEEIVKAAESTPDE